MSRTRHTGAGKIAAAPRAPRPTGILPIHACMINSDNESLILRSSVPEWHGIGQLASQLFGWHVQIWPWMGLAISAACEVWVVVRYLLKSRYIGGATSPRGYRNQRYPQENQVSSLAITRYVGNDTE